MKTCKICSAEFEPKHLTRGHEQLYCSIACRTRSYKARIMTKYQNDEKDNQAKDPIGVSLPPSQNASNSYGGFLPSINLEILEGKYQAKTEALEYKLRYEQSQRELEAVKGLNIELRSQLDECDTMEDDNEDSGGIMGFMREFPDLSKGIGNILARDEFADFVIAFLPKTPKKQ